MKVEDIDQIREQLDPVEDGKRPFRVIMFAGLPGVGKTTAAKLLAQKMQGVHFNIDDVKEELVPVHQLLDGIDSPDLRFSYYTNTIRRFPMLFKRAQHKVIAVDETFHLRDLREAWDAAMSQLEISAHWVAVTCSSELVWSRLNGRVDHHLGAEAMAMHERFKKVYEPIVAPFFTINSETDVSIQLDTLIQKLS